MKKLIKSTIVVLNLFLFIFLIMMNVNNIKYINANTGGFGVSGSFAGYHYKLVPGESIKNPNVYVTFYNNYEKDIQVKLFPTGPEGVSFDLEKEIVSIKAKNSIRIPIGIVVEEDTVPGEYLLGLAAEVIPDEYNGIQIVGSAELRAPLSIYGEAGKYKVVTVDSKNTPFNATLNIYRIENGTLFPVGYTEDGLFEDRVIPGEYLVRATYNGKVVAEKYFTVNDGDDFVIELTARTVYIKTFVVGPNFDEESPYLLSTTIVYSVENIYLPITDVRLMLVVSFNGRVIDEVEMLYTNYLDVGVFEGRYTFIPKSGWRSGNYSFKIELYEDYETESVLLDQSTTLTYNVPSDIVEYHFDWLLFVVIVMGSLIILILLFLFYKKNKDKDYYELMRKYILGFDDITSQASKKFEQFMLLDKKLAILSKELKIVKIHLHADIKAYPVEQYNHKDDSNVIEFKDVPFLMEINSNKSFNLAKKVFSDVYDSESLKLKKEDKDNEIK